MTPRCLPLRRIGVRDTCRARRHAGIFPRQIGTDDVPTLSPPSVVLNSTFDPK